MCSPTDPDHCNQNQLLFQKTWSAILILVFLTTSLITSVSAQVVFSYGKQKVTKNQFLHAYQKNNSDTTGGTLSYNEYLELYLRFKLKVQAALDAGMDTLPEQLAELDAFKIQLAESFMKDDASLNMMIDEAFERSLVDIHLSHIFIPVPVDAPDSIVQAAKKTIDSLHAILNSGASFKELASKYNSPDLGWITCFVLPYDLENLAYSTKPGSVSAPLRTKAGFHLFKNEGQRKAVGKVRVAQILFAVRPNTPGHTKPDMKKKADSVYQALTNGADFGQLVEQYSDDNLSWKTGGELPDFGVGDYDPGFEKMAFSLAKDSQITQPFETTFGFHILKRLHAIPVIEDKNLREYRDLLKEKIERSDRMTVAQSKLVNHIRNLVGKDMPAGQSANDSAVLGFYRKNIEKYNSEYAEQLAEFKDGNLLFNIMQKKIWDPASADSTSQLGFYNSHPDKYWWEQSADALIVTTPSPDSVGFLQETIKSSPASWRQISASSGNSILIDSGRFELSQLPIVERTNFTEHLVTAPVNNELDHTATFSYIIRLHRDKERKEFNEARGAVITDYQDALENIWIAELKKKYPVKINRKVLKSLPPPKPNP